MLVVRRVDAKSEDLLDPSNAVWRKAKSRAAIVMSQAALTVQANDYVRLSWEGRPYAAVRAMQASALHNGKGIFFRLAWDDDTKDHSISDINQFVDAAAVMFPIAPDAQIVGMSSTGKPVNAWLWRADWKQPKNVTAEGQSTTQRRDDPALAAKAKHTRGRWYLVISRSLDTRRAPSNTAVLKPGTTAKVGFAIWNGANQERAGIKAFSGEWEDLEIEA